MPRILQVSVLEGGCANKKMPPQHSVDIFSLLSEADFALPAGAHLAPPGMSHGVMCWALCV